MKKVLLILVFVAAVSTVKAQEFKPFQLYLGLGYTIPTGGGGILFDFEPAYRISDEIAVGLRMEAALMGRVVGDTEASISGTTSYTVNGKYYFSNGKFRPYAGVGVGLFSLASVAANGNAAGASAESKIGFYPRLGFDLGHFNINLDYNIIPSSEAQGVDNNGNETTFDIKNSYMGIRIGAFIFGGRN
ncbi:outer membrane beta-barrel protein [Marivirga sp. S37H4]|uniref:Outer membrane beta-barrel protein n=1 Tax=Marivirga aurantiaca TaxID=2802615 RepID=A0A934WXQ4_9BACT|nr:outer membrane beta-barrel protein [Marivirga aurantiaca]MBK6265079.1 outer membrane beta-barrel protein [Marivirga aurantiaca]